ncbi:porphobilinogen synthase [Fluviispira multicolorata]|uniref:Delta-aminolevulinic acid dehydratase n=1 Tax=Fluviispira multicolorata TaxID=2654512 RepID=A0A833JI75_9BACT|nr:porphobilinogen synthase [Fluviispira multicolorata]KAB8033752.1 porphobilinogen synthase [Fluviispira multicolorata]
MNRFQVFPALNIGNAHIRPRRLRINKNIRSLVQENKLQKSDLIFPLFISEKGTKRYEIPSLSGIFRIPYDELLTEVEEIQKLGIKAIMLFPVIEGTKKDDYGTEAYNPEGLMQNCIRKIKETFPNMILFVDVALDPYTLHGHDGIIDEKGYVLNDETVEALCKQSLSYAACGVDFVCPSDMMDGRIAAIRTILDKDGYIGTSILAYSAKFASAFYGPFREAIASGARGLDKKTYQLNPANSREAIREAILDIQEGADMVMVKPGLPYLDILSKIKSQSEVPVVIYQVSGEYAMLKCAAQNNLIDEKAAVYESLISMKRAGADLIVTYYAKWLCENLL